MANSKRSPLGVLCTVVGCAMVVVTLAVAVLMALPTVLGLTQLTVLTGSMAPAVPVGSMVYVQPVDPADLIEGDIVTYRSKGDTVTHRVQENRTVEGRLVTKGDANAEADVAEVPYADVVGKVVFTVPVAGDVLGAVATTLGKIYLLAFGACGIMFVVLGGRLRRT